MYLIVSHSNNALEFAYLTLIFKLASNSAWFLNPTHQKWGYSVDRSVRDWSFPIRSEDRRFWLSPENFSDQILTNFSRSWAKLPKSVVEFISGCSVGREVRNQSFSIGSENRKLWLLSENFSNRTSSDFDGSRWSCSPLIKSSLDGLIC